MKSMVASMGARLRVGGLLGAALLLDEAPGGVIEGIDATVFSPLRFDR